jgi:uncharacterized caspase-like protein
MKRLIWVSVLPLLFISLLQAQSFKKYAVIVGVADYQGSGMDLRYSDDDAYRFYAYLQSCEGGVDAANISVLIDEAANKSNILATMERVFAKAGPEDMLIFYFSGHGTEGAFCPEDATNQYSSLLSHDEIKSVFKRHPAKYKIVFADACFSGSIYEGKPTQSSSAPTSQETNIAIIMSSSSTETSQENVKIRQGAFSYYLLKGLKGAADRNSDKVITLVELFPYIKANVLNFTQNKQTPFIIGNASQEMPVGYINQ